MDTLCVDLCHNKSLLFGVLIINFCPVWPGICVGMNMALIIQLCPLLSHIPLLSRSSSLDIAYTMAEVRSRNWRWLFGSELTETTLARGLKRLAMILMTFDLRNVLYSII
jgi:hypothetical protein